MDIDITSSNILMGALIGVTSTFLGWLKSSKPGKFSLKGMLFKLPAGMAIGIGAAVYHVQFTDAVNWAAGLGFVEAIDNLTKLIIRRFFPKWGYFEGNAAPDEAGIDPAAASALIKISAGKGIDRDAVIFATQAFRAVLSKYLDVNDSLDKQMFDSLSFAANQILQNIRKKGWSDETINDAGKMIFRLFQVYRQYRGQRADYTADQWMTEMKTVLTLAQAVFNGAVNPLK